MKSVKLSVKLIGSFVIVAAITLVVGFVGWRGIASLAGHLVEVGEVRLPSIQNLLVIEREAESIRVAQRTLLNPNLSAQDKERQFNNIAAARDRYQQAWKTYEALPHTAAEAGLWKQFLPAWDAWRNENNAFMKLARELDELDVGNPVALRRMLQEIRGDHYKVLADTALLLAGGDVFSGGEDHTACRFGKWSSGFKSANPALNAAINHASEPHHRFHETVAMIKDAVRKSDPGRARELFTGTMKPAAERVFGSFDDMRKEAEKAEDLYDRSVQSAMVTARQKQVAALDLLGRIIEENEAVAHTEVQESRSQATRAKTIAIAGMLAGFGVALAFGIFLGTSISRTLLRIIDGLKEGSEQVASAAGQVSSASQSLAEGASEQAASVEETSSSLEEMSSMTRQNAENANQADRLMKEANNVVRSANAAMEDLNHSMEEISRASQETSKIIKTIDEIAFQTNLLALNAAVEAARAGEAGAGFAVVADEVRNLAMRAAEAARNTAGLIEGTVKKVKEGTDLVARTNDTFTEVAASAARVGDLVGEIAAACGEQAQGIGQVNTAVSEVDKVTQQNAASAEESASAAEEMSAQAEQMRAYVNELVELVGGAQTRPRPSGRVQGRGSGAEAVRRGQTEESAA